MALKLDDAIFNKASDQSMNEALIKTAPERLKALGSSAFPTILAELKKSSVDKTLIAELECEINSASDKNQAILDVINKGGLIAESLLKILK